MAESTMEQSKVAVALKAIRSGMLGGAVTPTLLQPLEMVKTRMQRAGGPNEGRVSMVQIIRNVVRNEGFFRLWNGLSPALVRSVPGVGLYFGCMETMKTAVTRGVRPMTAMEGAVVGASARFIAAGVLMPATVLKTRFESGLFQYKGLWDALRTIVRQEGFPKLFSGMVPVMVRDLPYASAYLGFYTHAQAWMTSEWVGLDDDSMVLTVVRTSYAGFMAAALTQPPDVIKTRMQLHMKAERMRLLPAIVAIHADAGFAGFFRGLLPRLLRRPLVSVIQWTFYDTLMKKK